MGVCSYCHKYRPQYEECFGWDEARSLCGIVREPKKVEPIMTSDTALPVELDGKGLNAAAIALAGLNNMSVADEVDQRMFGESAAKVIRAYLRALSATRTAVKPLEWVESFQDRGDGSSELSGWEAEMPGFSVFYTIEIEVSGFSLRRQDLDVTELGAFSDPGEAKADYERRILYALSTTEGE